MWVKNYKKLSEEERNTFLESIEEIFKKCKVDPSIKINYESNFISEDIDLRNCTTLVDKCGNPKYINFTITISGRGEKK